jgi:hypothetical protein
VPIEEEEEEEEFIYQKLDRGFIRKAGNYLPECETSQS